MDDLYRTYIASPEAATGKIPIVAITHTIPITSGSGAQKSTNYQAVFKIEGWTDRPDILGPRTVPMKTNGHAGYTPAPAPQPVTQPAMQPVAPVVQNTAQPPAGMPF
jgi:hypothetical protein